MTQRFYSATLLILIASSLAFITLFNWAVDPYAIFESPATSGIATVKPKVAKQAMLHKAYRLIDHNYNGLLLGNSRIYRGINPNSDLLKSYHFYNMGIRAASPLHMWHYLQHANHTKNIRHVILGLDFNFPTTKNEARTDFVIHRLHSGDYRPSQKWIDFRNSLLSYSAFSDSLSTLRHQRKFKSIVDKDGFQHLRKELGQKKHFEKIEDYIENQISSLNSSGFEKNSKRDFLYIQKIVRYCYSNNIELFIFISPIHARLLEVFHETGIWNEFEQWKIDLLSTTLKEAEISHKQPFPIWDFAIYNTINTQKPDNDASQWFYESSHYKPIYGDKILSYLLKTKDQVSTPILNIGIKIEKNNVTSHLENEAKKRQRYFSEIHNK